MTRRTRRNASARTKSRPGCAGTRNSCRSSRTWRCRLVVPREDGPAASLASYQLEVLRDKNRELGRRLQELFANAQENERLAVRTHQLALALMRADSAADTVRAMAATLAEDFHGDLVRWCCSQPVAGLRRRTGCRCSARDERMLRRSRTPRERRADLRPPHPDKLALLFGERATSAVDRADPDARAWA